MSLVGSRAAVGDRSPIAGLPVTIADDPLSAVANGTGVVLSDLNFLLPHFTSEAKS